ncbi:MAG: Rap1a/Tai family immunity protein [Alphaproteobacteria bacterium]
MIRLALLMAAVLFGFTNHARAAQFSGDYLLQMCASDKEGKELVAGGHIACQAYIAGVLDYHNLMRSLNTSPGIDFCVPDNVSMYTLQDQIVAFIFRHKKDYGAFVASPAVTMALFTYYPCRK